MREVNQFVAAKSNAGRNFLKLFRARKVPALAEVKIKSTGLFTPSPGRCLTWM
jgi:hypothetical protein